MSCFNKWYNLMIYLFKYGSQFLFNIAFKVLYTFDNIREERETKFGLFNEKSDIYVKFPWLKWLGLLKVTSQRALRAPLGGRRPPARGPDINKQINIF